MTVRFVPEEKPGEVTARDRENLAEVIDLRSKLLINREDLEDSAVETEEPEADISEIARKLLARKAMSSGELKESLLEKGFDMQKIEEILEDFQQSLYLDDLGLSRIMVEKLHHVKKLSTAQIRAKLSQRKIPFEVINQVITEIPEESESQLLRDLAFKRARVLRDLPRDTAKRRLTGFLARRGFSGPEVFRVIDEALQ